MTFDDLLKQEEYLFEEGVDAAGSSAPACWLCRMIGHRWVTHRRYKVDDMEATQATVWGCCTRCGKPTPQEIAQTFDASADTANA
jgi:hypothetical protein